MEQLTKRQGQILRMIQQTIEKTGMPPTRYEICDKFGFRSPTAAEDHLRALERKGAIELLGGTSRGIRLAHELSGIPVVGRVAAGEPILAEEHIEEYFDINPKQFKPKPHYILRVRGQSMRDVGILNNDLLVVHKTKEARSGQIVVARVEDEVTVKRFRKRGYQVTLQPENEDFDSIEIDLRETYFMIEGLAVGVLRTRVN